LIEAYRLALTAPEIGFEVVTIVGEGSRRRWDLSRAEKVLGYRSSIRLEGLGHHLGSEREPVLLGQASLSAPGKVKPSCLVAQPKVR
jgi:uronate dehydrogenase